MNLSPSPEWGHLGHAGCSWSGSRSLSVSCLWKTPALPDGRESHFLTSGRSQLQSSGTVGHVAGEPLTGQKLEEVFRQAVRGSHPGGGHVMELMALHPSRYHSQSRDIVYEV